MIKILVVDDQKFTREALQAILEPELDFEIVGKANGGSEAFEYLEQTKVDITIVDLEMPEMNGLTVTKMLGQRFPETKVTGCLTEVPQSIEISCYERKGGVFMGS